MRSSSHHAQRKESFYVGASPEETWACLGCEREGRSRVALDQRGEERPLPLAPRRTKVQDGRRGEDSTRLALGEISLQRRGAHCAWPREGPRSLETERAGPGQGERAPEPGETRV